jgi:hypothetical protein
MEPFSGLFNLGNNQKSQGAMSGEYRSLANNWNAVFGQETLDQV